MTDRYLNELREIILQNLKDLRLKVYLFGSRANGVARTGSDCDIGIDPLQELPVGLLSRLGEKLEESHVPYEVELVDLSEVRSEFAEKIREEGLLWIDTSKG